MKRLIALIALSQLASCALLGGTSPTILFSTAQVAVGGPHETSTVIGFDFLTASLVVVTNETVALGVYQTGTDVPAVVNGSPLERVYSSQRVILVQLLESGTRRLELDIGDPVPQEWQANVKAAVTPGRLAALQARGVLVFQ